MFEFDPAKSKSNKNKHGIDFETASELWSDSDRVIIQVRTTSEERFLLVAQIDNTYWSAIYTNRRNKIRIISVRKSRKNEIAIYNSL